jgi:hypothetical protein
MGVRGSRFNYTLGIFYIHKNERGEIRGMIDPKRKLNGDKRRREPGAWSGVTGVSRERARRVLHNSIRNPRVPHHTPVQSSPRRRPRTPDRPRTYPLLTHSLSYSPPGQSGPCLGLTCAMTTPTSSATTPSPTMAYLHTTPVSLAATMGSGDDDATEREARQQAIRKFLARAEISKVSLILLCLGSWYASSNPR